MGRRKAPTSVLERQLQQKESQARREEAAKLADKQKQSAKLKETHLSDKENAVGANPQKVLSSYKSSRKDASISGRKPKGVLKAHSSPNAVEEGNTQRDSPQCDKTLHEADDIEICFSDGSEEEVQEALPRKSPRKSSSKKVRGSAEKQPRESTRKISPKKRKEQDKREAEIVQADDSAEESEGSLSPVTKASICNSLPSAVELLKERILDSRNAGPQALSIRPSLQKLQGQLESLLRATVNVPGENNSTLVIGSRGVGKTLAVERAISTLQQEFNSDPNDPRIGFVRLTGLLHTEERSAFREIARQLCRSFKCSFSKAASLEDNLEFLRDMLKELKRGDKVVIFILDEFDMFAKKTRQTLLYNLLDAMQAADVQAAVVGLSCRSDVTEMLEKRVKSRFSYRRHLVLNTCSVPIEDKSEGTLGLLREMIRLPEDVEDVDSNFTAHFNRAAKHALQEESVKGALQVLSFKGIATPRVLGDVAVVALCGACQEQSLLQADHILAGCKSVDTDQNVQVKAVQGLSVLELFILVAFARLRRKGQDTPNFEMAFDEYSSLRRGGSYRGVDDTAPRSSAFRAFERLVAAALIAFQDSRAGLKCGMREFAPACLLLTQQELEEGIKSNTTFPPVVMEWLTKDSLASHAVDNATAVL